MPREHLHYRGRILYSEGVNLEEVAQRAGTPFYLYSRKQLLTNFARWQKAFQSVPYAICYSMKANSSLALCAALAQAGAGVDIVSGGELFRALKAGFPPSLIVFSGVGKTQEEIQEALKAGILLFNVESLEELETINRVAGSADKKAPVALRINPDIDANTHHHITTGKAENKFGIPFSQIKEVLAKALRYPHLKLLGLQAHVGSQITTVAPYTATVRRLIPIVEQAKRLGAALQYLDLGGGLGIRYRQEKPPEPKDLAREILPLLKGQSLKLIFEPGRSLVGDTGILVTKVLYRKHTSHKHFLIVDAAMNDLARPALYDAYHEILSVRKTKNRKITADVVGPVCETGDYLAKAREVPALEPGALLAIAEAGAYGYSMSSQYNSRPRVAEVMADGKEWRIIRQRESYEDLVRGEKT